MSGPFRRKPLFISGLALAVAAFMATGPAAQQGAEDGPDQLSETYRDWQVRCGRTSNSETPRRCEMVQTLSQDGGTRQRVLTILITRGEEADPRITYITPFGVDLERGMDVIVDDTSLGNMRYRTCQQAGCIVAGEITAEALTLFQRGAEGKVRIWDLQGQSIDLGFSLLGFTGAWNRLGEL